MSDAANSPSRLCRLYELGQSVWLDDLGRQMLDDGSLARLIDEDCISGVTSNPVIFERSVSQTDAYDRSIAEMAAAGASVQAIYERLVEDDIRAAADLLRPIYDATGGDDGYVSLEVSPHLARDSEVTVAEAERFWRAVDRPNLLIKVPGTVEGLTAIRALIGRGINVNVTLLFDPDRYVAVAEAYQAGIEDWLAVGAGRTPPRSVASFFLSRIDAMVDSLLGPDVALRGATATALAQIAYRTFAAIYSGERWRALAAKGAAPQRLLWASTGTKDPAYSDVKYVEPLIAAGTVTTLPLQTLDAFRDHGEAAPALTAGAAAGRDRAAVARDLAAAGVDLDEVMLRLEEEGIEKFRAPFDKLLKSLAGKTAALSAPQRR